MKSNPVRRTSRAGRQDAIPRPRRWRSEEHTSELQSLAYLVCRLLLEKKKEKISTLLSPLSASLCTASLLAARAALALGGRLRNSLRRLARSARLPSCSVFFRTGVAAD